MIEIKEAKTKAQRKQFIQFQNELYAGVGNYVPTLLSDEMGMLDPDKNPAYEYCETKLFMAYRDGKPVGRLCALISHKYNELWNFKRMRFCRFDAIDDFEVTRALFDAAEAWAREKGLNEIMGPIGFCDLDKEGMLIEGFDEPGMFITYYNHPYYIEHMNKLGMTKEADWVEMLITLDKDAPFHERTKRAAAIVQRRLDLRTLEIKSKSDIKPYFKRVFALLNEAYKPLFGVVPLTDRQIDIYIKQFMPLVDTKLVAIILDKEDNVVGFGLGMPSLASGVKAANGRLLPFGIFRILHHLKTTRVMDLYLIAVHPRYQNKGVPAMIIDHLQNYIYDRFDYAETGPELELNEKVMSVWDGLERRVNRRRRCFIKPIE